MTTDRQALLLALLEIASAADSPEHALAASKSLRASSDEEEDREEEEEEP